jgi:hypothetical protein
VINRRRFLKDSLVATAGLSLVPAAAAARESSGQGAPISSTCMHILAPFSTKDGRNMPATLAF